MNIIKRNIKFLVVHCTATPQDTTIESIKHFWKTQRGWGDTPGYHYIIKANGEIIQLLPETQNSYGVYKHNSECISIACIGGVDKNNKPVDNRTEAQKHSLFDLIVTLTEKYPKATVCGHRDFEGVKKACPCYDVKEWLANYTPDLDLDIAA